MKKAVAVSYKEGLPAPFVIAKGKNELAEKLVSVAERCNIHIVQEEELADRLYMLDLGEIIPEEVYEIVAEILAYVYTMQSKMETV